jgi:tetratricopeptide (TPR) repeat protein
LVSLKPKEIAVYCWRLGVGIIVLANLFTSAAALPSTFDLCGCGPSFPPNLYGVDPDLYVVDPGFVYQSKVERAATYYKRGLAYFDKGDLDRAIVAIGQAIKLVPKDFAYFSRARVHSEKGEYDLAVADFNHGIELTSKKAQAFLERGNIYELKGDHDHAMADYDQAIKLIPKPKSVSEFLTRGAAYDSKGNHDLAIADYTKAIGLSSKSADAFLERASAYGATGNVKSAMDDFNNGIKLAPKNGHAYMLRGLMYEYNSQQDRAVADYDQSIRLTPNPKWSIEFLTRGLAYHFKGEHERAIADLDQIIKRNNNDPLAFTSRGRVQLHVKNFDQALHDLNEAIRLAPQNAEAYGLRGQAWEAKGDLDRARQDYTAALSRPASDFLDYQIQNISRERLATVATTAPREELTSPPPAPRVLSAQSTSVSDVGHFIGELKFRMEADGSRMMVLETLSYVDAEGIAWTLPEGSVVDFSSIPRVLWPITGSPMEGHGRRAYSIYEYYVDTRSRDSAQLNKTLYYMLLADGVPELQAKTIELAVTQFGPRWYGVSQVTRPVVGPDQVTQLQAQIAKLQDEINGLKQRMDKGQVSQQAQTCSDPPFDRMGVLERRSRVLFVASDHRCYPTYTRSYALVIGVEKYTFDYWWKLPEAVSDADKIADALERYHGFSVTRVPNPDSKALRDALITFAIGPGQDPEARRLVVFYAGHGKTLGDPPLLTGWIIPADTPDPNKNMAGFIASAISMNEVLTWSHLIQAKHLFWIFDSCFSGEIVDRLRGGPSANWRQFLRDGKVRRVITSGSGIQRVPDKSVFASALIRGLRGSMLVGDNDEFFTGEQLSMALKREVVKDRGDAQTPQLGTMTLFGSDEGDIVFNRAPSE